MFYNNVNSLSPPNDNWQWPLKQWYVGLHFFNVFTFTLLLKGGTLNVRCASPSSSFLMMTDDNDWNNSINVGYLLHAILQQCEFSFPHPVMTDDDSSNKDMWVCIFFLNFILFHYSQRKNIKYKVNFLISLYNFHLQLKPMYTKEKHWT